MSQPVSQHKVSAQCLSTFAFSSNQSVKGLANPLRMVITMVEQKSLHWELMWWSSQSDVIQSQHYSANRNWIKDISENQVSIRNRWYLTSTELKTRKATLRTGVPCMYFSVREEETSQFQIVAFSAHVPTSSATAWRLHTQQPGKTPRDQATVNYQPTSRVLPNQEFQINPWSPEKVLYTQH